jgi:hypothetical protein
VDSQVPVWQIAIGPVLGFASAWAAFEVTERRKVRLAQRELRQALVSELEHAEVTLSTFIGKHARFADSPGEIAAVAKEIRWFVDVGRVREKDSGGLPSELAARPLESIRSLTDQQLVALYASRARQDTIGTKLVLPIVEAVLAGRTAGFRANELQSLSTIKWQAHLLEQDADLTRQFLSLSFTVTDPTNHHLVVANREMSLQEYARRAAVLQGCVRSGLAVLRR